MNFFYPPQPTRLWPSSTFFRNMLNSHPDYDAEIKFNGWRLEIHVHENSLIFYNRHGTIINIDSNKFLHAFKDVPVGSIFDGELIDKRTKNIKNVIVLWDCMFWGNKDIRPLPLKERRTYLKRWVRVPKKKSFISKDLGQVFRTYQVKSKLIEFYEIIVEKNNPLEEGIVIKNNNSKYDYSIKGKFDTINWYKIKKPGEHTKVRN